MSTQLINIGNQQITFDFKNQLKGSEFNKLLYGVLKQGIYSGGTLSNVGNTISVNPFTALFESNSENATIITTTSISSISSISGGLGDINDSTPYIVMNYTYEEQIENWINFEFKATPLSSDIIIGKATFDGGGAVTGFLYDESNIGLLSETIMDSNGAGVRFGGAGSRITTILDEDNMSSNSDISLATQASIQAYKSEWRTKTITTATYTVTDNDMRDFDEIMFDTTTNSITVTLPDRITNNGKKIKCSHSIQGGINNLIINCAVGDEITSDQLTIIELPKEGNYLELLSSSILGYWEILSENNITVFSAYGYAGDGSVDTAIQQVSTKINFYGNIFSQNHDSGYNSSQEGLEIIANRRGFISLAISETQDIVMGFSLNSSQLTTSLQNINEADKLTVCSCNTNLVRNSAGISSFPLEKNDIVRLHSNGDNSVSSLTLHITMIPR